MPKNTKVVSKKIPVKKPKIRQVIKKKSKTIDLEKDNLERDIRAKNLKMGIIEVLELSENESTYGIEPNNPLISSSTPLKTLPQTITNISQSPDSTKTEINQPVESEDILPLPLKIMENLLKPVSPQITIIVTPPTPEKDSESAYTPEHNPFLLIPPDDSEKIHENKRPPDIRKKTSQITTIPNLNAASNSSILGGKTSTNFTPNYQNYV